MKIKEAAFIIGSLGGRPPLNPPVQTYREAWRGGYIPPIPTETFYLLQEDGISRIMLEDGSGFLLLEF